MTIHDTLFWFFSIAMLLSGVLVISNRNPVNSAMFLILLFFFMAGLLLVLATIALVLSSVGLYGVVTYSVAMRTQEIGIRLALGARAGDVLHLVLRRGVIITGVGVIIGLGIAALLAKLLESLLIGVSVTDPATYLGLGAVLIAVTLVASYLPARRATKIDPLEALRHE